MSKSRPAFVELDEYFYNAKRMWQLTYDHARPMVQNGTMITGFQEHWMRQSLAYACLYVVVEGWKELGFKDPGVDRLLTPQNVELLKKYRHATFHFQRSEDYKKKTNPFLEGPDNPLQWVDSLMKAFEDYLGRSYLEYYRQNPDDPVWQYLKLLPRANTEAEPSVN